MAKKIKFKFGIDFQELILKYTLTEDRGHKLLGLYEDSYFTLLNHAIIAHAIKRYFKKKHIVPDEPMLKETLRVLYNTDKPLFENLKEKDRVDIDNLVTSLFVGRVGDMESIQDACINFCKYVNFKKTMESVSIEDYNSYAAKITDFQKINTIGIDLVEDFGTFIIGDVKNRTANRNNFGDVYETPFWQLNRLFNGGGSHLGNVFCLISKEKFFKTGFLINISKGYMKRKCRVMYFDFENGERLLATRLEQSIMEESQATIMSGERDRDIRQILKRYKRIGVETVIKRMPALSTTDDMQAFMDKVRTEKAFVADIVVVDYGFLTGATTGAKDEFNRISDSFLDYKNFASRNKLRALWTAGHVTREGDMKRTGTKYKSTDIAKCIDIPRHVDGLFSLQQDESEKENGVMRLEVIEQRNGVSTGKCLFWLDIEKQLLKEFTKKQVKNYYEELGERDESDLTIKHEKKKRKTDL